MIPKDPIILLSWVNTKLRDNYPSLDRLCYDEEVDKPTLIAKLAQIGYVYNPQLNKFV